MYRISRIPHAHTISPSRHEEMNDISEIMYEMTRAVRTMQGYVDATLRLVPTLPERKQAELLEECTSMSDEANELIKFHNELLHKQKALAGKQEGEEIQSELEALSLAGLALKNARAKKERQLLSSQSQAFY
jgi:hypothetical protein